ELNVGRVPFAVARIVLPFVKMDNDARLAMTAVRDVEVSVHELTGSEPNRARILSEADKRMSQRGWDRVVGVLNKDVAVAVYAQGKADSDLKISVLVLNEKHMVAVTGRGN